MQILATASVAGQALLPWAVTSKHLTYVADMPLGTTSTHDASLALADLLHDLVPKADSAREQPQRALVRIEDVGPMSNPAELRAIAEALQAEGVPFSFTVYPLYVGPIVDGKQKTVALAERPQVVRAIVDMLDGGATMVSHGYTHQFGTGRTRGRARAAPTTSSSWPISTRTAGSSTTVRSPAIPWNGRKGGSTKP